MQISKHKIHSYIVEIIKKYCPDYDYFHFTDSEAILFLKENPLSEFPNVIEKFNSFTKKQHSADLFRYYYLYIKGGVYLDSDAIFEVNIENIIKTYDSVFVKSVVPNTIFNGFIATQPNNKIIYEALCHMYHCKDEILLSDYFHSCKELYNIYYRLNLKNTKIYLEKSSRCSYNTQVGITIDDENTILLTHYWKSKIIPKIESR